MIKFWFTAAARGVLANLCESDWGFTPTLTLRLSWIQRNGLYPRPLCCRVELNVDFIVTARTGFPFVRFWSCFVCKTRRNASGVLRRFFCIERLIYTLVVPDNFLNVNNLDTWKYFFIGLADRD